LPVIDLYPLTRRDAPTSPRKRGEVKKGKKAGIAPGLQFVHHSRNREPYFASARFGGGAGHDFTRVS
jgi:hypothetical protein